MALLPHSKAAADTAPLLGLFNGNHISYDADRNVTVEPSLEEMTLKALKILENKEAFPMGYVLLVEAGRIDHAHHEGNWYVGALRRSAPRGRACKVPCFFCLFCFFNVDVHTHTQTQTQTLQYTLQC